MSCDNDTAHEIFRSIRDVKKGTTEKCGISGPHKGYQRTTLSHELFKFKPFHRHLMTLSYKDTRTKYCLRRERN
jgi:hypothetical protein